MSEKRHNPVLYCKHILLDIEGTTTSISYVKDKLFPYARENLREFLNSNWNSEQCKEDIKALQVQSEEDYKEDKHVPVIKEEISKATGCLEQVMQYVSWAMEHDKKTTALKQLQGHIYEQGFQSGSLKGHIYPDVVPALKKWRLLGKRMYIYSSGSVEAQKLLYGYSEEGDLLEYLSGHYDTKIGGKLEANSYNKIAKDIGDNSCRFLFVTDNIKEARAAKSAGMNVLISRRPGNVPLTELEIKEFGIIDSFDDIIIEHSDNEVPFKRTSNVEINELNVPSNKNIAQK